MDTVRLITCAYILSAFVLGIFAIMHEPYWGLAASFVASIGFTAAGGIAYYELDRAEWESGFDVLAKWSLLVFGVILPYDAWTFTWSISNTAGFILCIGLSTIATIIAIVIWVLISFEAKNDIFSMLQDLDL